MSPKVKQLIHIKLEFEPDLATSKACAFSFGFRCFSRTQTWVAFVVNGNFVCLKASEDRLGVQKMNLELF